MQVASPHLNPYDRDAVPGSILKIEDDNCDPKTKKQRQLYCLAISAKRYALFLRDDNGMPVLLRKNVNNKDDRWSEHGLGHLLNPTDPESADREWIAQVWFNIFAGPWDYRRKIRSSNIYPLSDGLQSAVLPLCDLWRASMRVSGTVTKSNRSTSC